MGHDPPADPALANDPPLAPVAPGGRLHPFDRAAAARTGWHFTPVAGTVDISIVVIALLTDAYLTRRARRLAGVRSRPAYLTMAAGPLTLAVVCIYIAAVPLNVHHPRLSDLVALIGALSGWTALLALGRALTWGRLRRLCWIYPPAGSAANTQP